mmetsp:Transcript_56872/g.83236  ORF Transcript_56872/g.83236 Transcript_56872/m.83236 type:complete len:229 (+) Transcript_56872:128-814(+)
MAIRSFLHTPVSDQQSIDSSWRGTWPGGRWRGWPSGTGARAGAAAPRGRPPARARARGLPGGRPLPPRAVDGRAPPQTAGADPPGSPPAPRSPCPPLRRGTGRPVPGPPPPGAPRPPPGSLRPPAARPRPTPAAAGPRPAYSSRAHSCGSNSSGAGCWYKAKSSLLQMPQLLRHSSHSFWLSRAVPQRKRGCPLYIETILASLKSLLLQQCPWQEQVSIPLKHLDPLV